VTDRLLSVMKTSRVVCPHLHIPIQSAADPILAAMRRKYRKGRLQSLMDKMRKNLPEAGVGTDVIAGFPGETDELFEETFRFVETAGFSYLHVFPFSAREGTAAAKMADAVPETIIRRRVHVLRELSLKLQADFARRFTGHTKPVLFEEPEGERQTGLTENYLRVVLLSAKSLRGQIHPVILEKSDFGGIQCDPQILSGQIA